jgi:hypothetical protein
MVVWWTKIFVELPTLETLSSLPPNYGWQREKVCEVFFYFSLLISIR